MFKSLIVTTFMVSAAFAGVVGLLGLRGPIPIGNKSPKQSPFASLAIPLYFAPVRVASADVNLAVELTKVSILGDGSLEAPANWNEGGWFTQSAKSGQVGNMVIDGHYDDNLGAPAAFWNLKNLKIGDTVIVTDGLGRDFSYRVSEIFYVAINDPDRLDIFASADKPILTLITCGGLWLPGKGTYSSRLVIRSQLIAR